MARSMERERVCVKIIPLFWEKIVVRISYDYTIHW